MYGKIAPTKNKAWLHYCKKKKKVLPVLNQSRAKIGSVIKGLISRDLFYSVQCHENPQNILWSCGKSICRGNALSLHIYMGKDHYKIKSVFQQSMDLQWPELNRKTSDLGQIRRLDECQIFLNIFSNMIMNENIVDSPILSSPWQRSEKSVQFNHFSSRG